MNKIVVVHIVEAYGGGIQSAIKRYVDLSPEVEHRLITRTRVGHDTAPSGRLLDCQRHELEVPLVAFLARASRIAQAMNPDVIHLHSSYAGLARPFLRGSPARIVYTPHCFAFERRDKRWLERQAYKAVEWAMMRSTAQVFAGVSAYECHRARQLMPKAMTYHIPNAIQRTVDRPSIESRLTGSSVVTAGRIELQKDPEFFIRIIQEVKAEPIRWIWIGDGNPHTKRRLETHGVEVTGWIPNDHARNLMSTAALYVHTAAWEGDPVTPLEALSAGVPALVRKTPTTAQLGHLGFTSVDEAASIIERYFTDAEYRRNMVSASDSKRQQDIDTLQSELDALYQKSKSGNNA
ncbi:glycosyltransferase family 4 protein [Gordonia sp. NPDC003376]